MPVGDVVELTRAIQCSPRSRPHRLQQREAWLVIVGIVDIVGSVGSVGGVLREQIGIQ